MSYPNLFIVGQPKSGTTALHAFLGQHPHVYMSPLKEPHYFCTDFHEESDRIHGRRVFFPVRSSEDYLSLFKGARDKRVVGEASSNYLYSRVAIENIARARPDARLIAIVRHPLNFLVSLHKDYVKGGYEDQDSLLDALNLESERRKERNVPKAAICGRLLCYRQRMCYHEHLARCFEHFPREQVKVLIFEEFRQDNARAFREVAEWLGIDPTFQPKFRDVNKYGEGQLSPLARYVYHPRLRAAVRRLLPLRYHDAVWHLAFRLFWRESPEPKTDKAKIREILHDEINETIERTSEILGRDLYEVWGDRARHEKSEDQQQSAPDRASQ